MNKSLIGALAAGAVLGAAGDHAFAGNDPTTKIERVTVFSKRDALPDGGYTAPYWAYSAVGERRAGPLSQAFSVHGKADEASARILFDTALKAAPK